MVVLVDASQQRENENERKTKKKTSCYKVLVETMPAVFVYFVLWGSKPFQKHFNTSTEFTFAFLKQHMFHVVLVSLLLDQLSGLFLTFFGRPKKNLFSLREFLVSLWIFFGQALIFWYTKKKFWCTKKKFGRPKKSEPDQKFPETEQIFFWSTKKREK